MKFDKTINYIYKNKFNKFFNIYFFIINYVLSKLFIFKKPKKEELKEETVKTEGENEVG